MPGAQPRTSRFRVSDTLTLVLAWTRRRPWLILVAGVVALAGLAWLLAALGWDPNIIAAAASAVAAIAALASSVASANTARDATRALSYATKPILRFELSGNAVVINSGTSDFEFSPVTLRISNVSTETIGRASVSWRLRDGQTGHIELGPLKGRRHPHDGKSPVRPSAYDWIELGKPTPRESSGVDRVTVDYWGVYGSIGWRRVVEWRHEYSRGQLPNGLETASYSVGEHDVSEAEIG